jgi:hypothetical protein
VKDVKGENSQVYMFMQFMPIIPTFYTRNDMPRNSGHVAPGGFTCDAGSSYVSTLVAARWPVKMGGFYQE